ncbi:MAG TPA: hypothetical protein DD414_12440 [Lachnospiraceae bacterium]|nr:hypothetical protein [Lachnospiraceae bacterium]
MKIIDKGVTGNSFMDFATPSKFAKKALYYCSRFGHFYCDSQYCIARDSLDLFLLMYIRRGALTVETQNRVYTASEGEVVFLDCRFPHRYYCKDTVEFLWFHFGGCSSIFYAEYLYSQRGVLFPGDKGMEQDFISVLRIAEADIVDEHHLSLLISRILCRLASAWQYSGLAEGFLRPAADFIRVHYSESVSLDDLAEQCRISKPHLIRSFKRSLNCTPHEYLLAYRLRQAKHRLVGSSASIEEIAEQCGFNSASHFTRAFRTNTGMTPTEFRKLQF